MSKDTTVTPKLRFPEFLEAGEWEEKSFGELYSFKTTNSYSRDMLNYENGTVRNIHYGDIHTKFSTLFDINMELVPFINPSISLEKIKLDSYCIEGDIIFADASEDLSDIGKSIEIVKLNNEKILSGLHTLLARQKEATLIVGFGGYLLKSNKLRSQIKRESQGSKVFGISAGRMSNIQVSFPADKKEQQKIAACLSSLDDRISAESQKLAALKTHKKGLMQQLFPAEGETVPKLRFSEFEGEWGEKQIGHISENVTAGGTPSTSEKEYWGGSIRWMNSGELNYKKVHDVKGRITEEGLRNSSTKIIPKMCVLIGLAGQGKTRGTVAMNMVKLCINQSIAAIFPNEKIFSSDFLYHNLDKRYDELRKLSTGGEGRGGLNLQIIKSLAVPLPSLPEQQKIAACLSSLDELINAQSQKIEKLKEHKKGLMQQLFPTPDEMIR